MSDNLRAAAALSGLPNDQKKQVEGLFNALGTHRSLLGLPAETAQAKFASLPKNQQDYLLKMFGEDPQPEASRGWFKSALHYAGAAVGAIFKPFEEASDLTTRLYRTAAIANDQGVAWFGKGNAWDRANDNGNKVFRPDAIKDAEAKFGADRVEVAMKLASGMKRAEVFAEATDAQRQIIAANSGQITDPLFGDALEAVKQARYSPGRDVASALGLRGTGAYNIVSGLGDAIWRIGTDPFLLAGKAKRVYDVGKFSLEVITRGGAEKVGQVFARKDVAAFWDQYGSKLSELRKATETAGRASRITAKATGEFAAKAAVRRDRELAKAASLRTELKRMAPEFNDEVVAELSSVKTGIKDAATAKNYFLNTEDALAVLRGQTMRTNPLMPRLDMARKARISMYTATDKIFNVNKIGPDFLRSAFVSDTGAGDMITGIINDPLGTAEKVKKGLASTRYTFDQVYRRIDAFSQKFEKIPFSRDGLFHHDAPDAVTQIYRIARISLPRYQSKMISEAYAAAGTDFGRKKEIFDGLWETVFAVRGVNKTPAGQRVLKQMRTGGDEAYATTVSVVDDTGRLVKPEYNPAQIAGDQMALAEFQTTLTSGMPSIREMDSLAARDGIFGRIMGYSHSRWAEKMTSYWSFLTLAGPRYALRNATEDFMMHLAVGNSPFAMAKGRWLSTTLRTVREGKNVGWINRIALRSEVKMYADKLAKIKATKGLSDSEKVTQIRELMVEAVAQTKMARWGVLKADELEIVKEQIMLGGLDNALLEVADGIKAGLRGTDDMIRATQLQKQSGAVAVLKFDEVLYARKTGKGGYGSFAPDPTNTETQVSWIAAINNYANDNIGKIAMANLENRQKAVNEIVAYFQANPEKWKRFRSSQYINQQEHAERLYDTVWNLFSNQEGKLNKAFYRQVVDPTTGKIFASELSPDVLPKTKRDMPAMISGNVYVPVAEGDNITAALIDHGWDWLGDMNARYSREPIMLDAMLKIRKEMAANGFQERFIAQRTQGLSGAALTSATKRARKDLAELAERRAVEYTLAYVDNPSIQTQMAFASRNFSRFYRATEDFYRRFVRASRYNPDALAKVALIYEGITHTGWIQEDANGEKYFLYPALAPVYKTMEAVLNRFDLGDHFKAPMPVQFGGRLNMVTPSANPDSLQPTFAGPVGALSMKTIGWIIGFWDEEAAKSFETATLGPYAQNRSTIELLLPSHINRVYNLLDKDERTSQRASAFRKVATYMEAAGHAPKGKIDPKTGELIPPSAGELELYRQRLDTQTTAILALRFMFGFFAPASPQLDYKSDMADWVRDSGVSSFKQDWQALVQKYEGDYERAMADWVKYFPDEVPYTVSENVGQYAAYIRASKKAGDFFLNNEGLFEQYPEGAPFLMPVSGDFTYDSWRVLKDNGFYAPKRVGDFLQEVQTSGDYAFYQMQKKDYELQLAAAPTDYEKRQLRDKWENWSRTFKGVRPLLAERQAQYATIKPQKMNALGDLERLLADKNVKVAPRTQAALKRMVALYGEYQQVSSDPFGSDFLRDITKQGIVDEMQKIAGSNPNAGAAWTSLFSYLMGVDA